MRATVPAAASLLLVLGCASETAGPDPELPGAGIDFGLPAGTFGAHQAEGSPSNDGPVLTEPFAVALPDSLGGLVILSHEPISDGLSNLFVLQLDEIGAGTFECGSVVGDSPCHGRLLMDLPVNGSALPGMLLEIRSGALRLDQAGPDRVRGTLQAVLAPWRQDVEGPTIVIENGTIDVPLVQETFVSGAVSCLRAYTGGQPLPAECR